MTRKRASGKKPLPTLAKVRLGVTRKVVIALIVIIVVGVVVATLAVLRPPSSSPSPAPTSTPTSTPTSSPSPSPSPTTKPSPTPTPTSTPTPTPNPTLTPSPTPTPKPTPTFNLDSSLTLVESGGSVTLTGTLSMSKTGTVDLAYAIGSSGFVYHRNETLANGVFTDSFGFLDLTTWQFKATWSGDETSNSAESNIVRVTVVKVTPTFFLTASSERVAVNDTIVLTGMLSVNRTGSVNLYWAIGSISREPSSFIYNTTETLDNGLFSCSFPLSQAGIWQFKVTYQGDSTTSAVTSNIVSVNVQ